MLNTVSAATRAESTSGNLDPQDPERTRAVWWLKAQIERAAKSGPFAEVVELTPALADVLLSRNPGNRRINARLVGSGKADLIGGNWDLNGETVIVADTGDLNDGQHRCMMVRQTGRSIRTFMVFGVARITRSTLDQGSKRTTSVVIGMSGVMDAANVAHAARLIWQIENLGGLKDGGHWRPTTKQVAATIEAHPELQDARPLAWRAYKDGLGSVGMHIALVSLFSRISKDDCNAFYELLITGLGFAGDADPVYQLRRRLTERRRDRTPEAWLVAMAINAWNKYRTKEQSKILRFRPAYDEFPVAK